jgi:four helix bundle protein
VYQKALRFVKAVRTETTSFPKEELFVLPSQFRRASDSVLLNIAEGSGNSSVREFSRFLDYSIRSGYECVGCLDISLELGYISIKIHQELFEQADEIIAMLVGLKKSQNNSI